MGQIRASRARISSDRPKDFLPRSWDWTRVLLSLYMIIQDRVYFVGMPEWAQNVSPSLYLRYFPNDWADSSFFFFPSPRLGFLPSYLFVEMQRVSLSGTYDCILREKKRFMNRPQMRKRRWKRGELSSSGRRGVNERGETSATGYLQGYSMFTT